MYDLLNSPITVGGLALKNRVVFAPTSMGLKEEAYFAKLSAIARGGAALLVIGDVSAAKGHPGSLFTGKGLAYYRRLTECVHQNGAKVSAQLFVSDYSIKGLLKYVPGMLFGKIKADDLRRLLNEQVSGYVTALPVQKLRELAHGFGTAAVLAKKAGFDMVQVHGDRLSGSLSSSVFNHRTDTYGGTAENRARFACEAVAAVRSAVPNMPIDYKLAVRQENPHYGNAGVLYEEISAFVPLLERAGVNSFHVALANHSLLTDTIPPANHSYFHGQGCFLPFADEVKNYSALPVCGVGRITSPDFAEGQLRQGKAELIAMSRQLIADPDWLNKAVSGREKEILTCTACNRECLGGMQSHQGVHCIWDTRRKKEDKIG